MSTRNMVWLGLIVVVGAVLWVSAGWLWGLIGAGGMLVASEVTERTRRSRIAAAQGRDAPNPLKGAIKRKQRR